MEIMFKTTNEISQLEWDSYTASFNLVFGKDFNIDDFLYKYCNTIDDTSYHVFLYSNDNIVGGFTLIPYEYYYRENKIRLGLAVDVFIIEEFRKNPLLILKMFNIHLNNNVVADLDVVAGVPNDMAYPFWKKVLKWRDIGCLPYYVLPVNAGNVISKARTLLNSLNKLLLKIWLIEISKSGKSHKQFPIHINKDNPIVELQRYTPLYRKIELNGIFFSYRIVDEDGVRTCYIIDFYHLEDKSKNRQILKKVIKYLLNNEKMDIIIYVGTLGFYPRYLIRVPFSKEPKHLYLMGNKVSDNQVIDESIYDFNQWDFGLFNYDVR